MSEKKAKNEWKIIKIDDLGDDEPVIALSEFTSKSMAKFHLATHVLYPIDGDWQLKKKTPKKEI